MIANKPSYEARGVVGSSPALRTKFKDRKFRRWLLTAIPNIVDYDITKIPNELGIRIVYTYEKLEKIECPLEWKRRRDNTSSILKNRFNLYRLYLANDKKCYICDNVCDFDVLTKDHVFPRSMGYPLMFNNMPACKKCNEDKDSRIPTTCEVQRACEAYEKLGMTFDPRKLHEAGHRDFLSPFKSIGLRRFEL